MAAAGVSRSCDGGPASSRGGPWRSACSGGGRRGHGTLAAGGRAMEAGGARTNKKLKLQIEITK